MCEQFDKPQAITDGRNEKVFAFTVSGVNGNGDEGRKGTTGHAAAVVRTDGFNVLYAKQKPVCLCWDRWKAKMLF